MRCNLSSLKNNVIYYATVKDCARRSQKIKFKIHVHRKQFNIYVRSS